MSDDFTVRLRVQLREAAIREERRGPVARTVLAARPRPVLAVGAFAAAAVAAAILLATVFLASPAPEPATQPGPRVAVDVAVGDALGASARPGFGAMWLSDSSRGAILRVDPRTLRVTRRIPVGSEVALVTAAGALWALPRGPGYQGGPLMRIAPDTGRTVAQIDSTTPAGGPFRGGSLVVAGGRVWVIGAAGAVAVDPATGQPQWRRRVGTDLHDAQVSGRRVFVIGADGPSTARDRLWEIDAPSGRIAGAITVPEFGPLGMVPVDRGVWLLSAGGRAVVVAP